MREQQLSRRLGDNVKVIEDELGRDERFDMIVRRVEIGGRACVFVYVDGLVKDEVMTRIMQGLLAVGRSDLAPKPLEALSKKWLAYLEVEHTDKFEDVFTRIMSGPVALLMDGENEALLIDVRSYPVRSPEEPDLERVTRGSRDGFVETLVFNTSLIRRRVRDPGLRFELVSVGKRSRSDVVVGYIKGVARTELVQEVKERLQSIDIDGLPMAEKTVEEVMLGHRYRWNPFPLIRFTERPDVAAVHLIEGHILILADTSPSVIILPATLFHHLQHAEEYRESPLVGVYLRWVRLVGMLLALIGPPLWVALVLAKPMLPEAFAFLGPREPGTVPLILQFLIGDLGLDLLRLALIHTPTTLATSLGLIGAVLLGELAVSVGLLSAEVVLYLAIAALGMFATPSMEFGLAIRLGRLFLLLAVAGGGLAGLGLGLVVLFVYLVRLKSFDVPYLWPLIPFDGGALWAVLVRRPALTASTRPSRVAGRDGK